MTKREMTIEEAIEIFKEVRAEVLAKETELSKQVFENLGIKAVDLAIKVLEQRLDIHDTCKKCVEFSEFKQKPCGDCISRADILDAIETWDKFGVNAEQKLIRWQDHYVPYVHLDDVRNAIANMPSVTPKGVTITDFADRCRECGKIKRCADCYYNDGEVHAECVICDKAESEDIE